MFRCKIYLNSVKLQRQQIIFTKYTTTNQSRRHSIMYTKGEIYLVCNVLHITYLQLTPSQFLKAVLKESGFFKDLMW